MIQAIHVLRFHLLEIEKVSTHLFKHVSMWQCGVEWCGVECGLEKMINVTIAWDRPVDTPPLA